MQPTAYIICTTPRSGSTMLCDLLTGSGIAGQPQSYFRTQDVAHWTQRWRIGSPASIDDREFNARYLAAVADAGKGGTDVFGLRLMWPSVGELAARLRSAFGEGVDVLDQVERAFGPTLLVHLFRRDKAAQAVSLLRAEQTGLWHVHADGTERQRTAPARRTRFDADRLRAIEAELTAEDRAWQAFFAARGAEPVRIVYEDLAAAPRAALTTIVEALHLDPATAAEIAPVTGRMAGAASERWARRLRGGRVPASPGDR